MRMTRPQKEKETVRQEQKTARTVQWEEQVAPPRRRLPLIFQILKFFGSSLSGAMLLIGIVAGIGLWRSGTQFVDGIKMALTPSEPEEEIDVRTVVVQQIQGASELTTAVFTMEAVVPTKSTRTLANYEIGKTTLIYIAHGEVRAGVDLSAIGANDVQVSETTLRVVLPAATIIDSKIDVNASEVYDYNRGFLGLGPDRAPELQDRAQEAALVKVTKAACDEGILQQASDRAELVVGQLLQNTGFERVEVESLPLSNSVCGQAETTAIQ
ncbi:MAG: DUF4230 domain-containing protein [Cyanobacteria bacterium J06639_14]